MPRRSCSSQAARAAPSFSRTACTIPTAAADFSVALGGVTIIMEIPMVDRLPEEFYDIVKNGDKLIVNADEGFVEITE